MSPPDERRAPLAEDSSKTSATSPTRPKSNSTTPTQRERVRRLLARGWVCGAEFLDPPDGYPPILRYSAHFHSLRREGWLIDRRECEHGLHRHPFSTMYQWTIVGHVDEGKLPLGGAA